MNYGEIDKQMLIEQLNNGLTYLTGKERLVLALTYFEELTENEICLCMDIDLFTYGSLITSARYKMRAFTDIFDRIDDLSNKGNRLKAKFFPEINNRKWD